MLINIKGVSITAKPRKDGRYQGYLMIEGRPIYYYGKTKKEVEEKILHAIQHGVKPKKKATAKKAEPTVAEWMSEWVRLYKKPYLKPKTLVALESFVKKFCQAFGDVKLKSVSALALQDYFNAMPQKHMRDAVLIRAKAAFAKAVKLDIIKKNPFDAVELPAAQTKKKNALTVQEQEKLVRAIKGNKFESLYLVLLTTGIRIGEALALTKDDVRDGVITVSKNVVFIKGERIVQQQPKTVAGIRKVFVDESILPNCDGDILFPFNYSAVAHEFEKICKRLSIRASIHTLRHTFATRLEEAGVPDHVRMYLMGHKNLQMTQNVYTDVQEDYVQSYTGQVLSAFDTQNAADLTLKSTSNQRTV